MEGIRTWSARPSPLLPPPADGSGSGSDIFGVAMAAHEAVESPEPATRGAKGLTPTSAAWATGAGVAGTVAAFVAVRPTLCPCRGSPSASALLAVALSSRLRPLPLPPRPPRLPRGPSLRPRRDVRSCTLVFVFTFWVALPSSKAFRAVLTLSFSSQIDECSAAEERERWRRAPGAGWTHQSPCPRMWWASQTP